MYVCGRWVDCWQVTRSGASWRWRLVGKRTRRRLDYGNNQYQLEVAVLWKNERYPLLFPLTLCSLKVTSFSSSSQPAWLAQPLMSSSVIHQCRSDTSKAFVAPGSIGRSSEVSFRLTPCCCGACLG